MLFAEFCREVTDVQMPQVAPVILPEMYNIFTQDQVSTCRVGVPHVSMLLISLNKSNIMINQNIGLAVTYIIY